MEGLIESGFPIVGVVTREDKPAGRGRKLQPTLVKKLAVEKGIEVLQPARTNDAVFLETIERFAPDISIIVAYGKILKAEALYLPRLGSICLHPSLLPLYRGASPVQRAILGGETETGVTIIQMDEGMDSGDILIQTRTPIHADERAGELWDRLSLLSRDTLIELLPPLESGQVHPIPQNDDDATFAPKITVEEARIDWKKDARTLELESRAFDPWPGPFTYFEGDRLRLFGIRRIPAFRAEGGGPGEVLEIEGDGPVVRTGDGQVKVTEFQSTGKKRMDAAAWMRGKSLEKGARFGQPEPEAS
jgi:methionyl-tRNA formyltransferase